MKLKITKLKYSSVSIHNVVLKVGMEIEVNKSELKSLVGLVEFEEVTPKQPAKRSSKKTNGDSEV